MQFFVSLLLSSHPYNLPFHHHHGPRPPSSPPFYKICIKDPKSSTQRLLDAILHNPEPRSLTTKYNQTTARSLLLLFQKGNPSTPIVSNGIDGIWAPANLICVK